MKALNDPTSDGDCHAAVIELKRIATESIDTLMDEHGIEIIAAPSDSTLVSFAACSGKCLGFLAYNLTDSQPGYPIATVPLGNVESNGQPFGLFLLAKANHENVLLKFMSLYEGAGVSMCVGPSIEA